jgi:flagellar protein FlaI
MQISDFFKSIGKSPSEGKPLEEPLDPVLTGTDVGDPARKLMETTPSQQPPDLPAVPLAQLPGPKKPDAIYRHYFQLLKGRASSAIDEYDFERHGTLVDAVIPDDYEQLDQYWVEKGRSLIIIAHNRKTNQKEYLLFEPTLSDFEYELLERLHEDLRDVLILTTEEIRKDRKRILLEKMHRLLDDYGLSLESSTMYKLQYFLIRNFIGWSRIDPLMKDPMLEDISCDGNKIPLFLYHRQYRNIKTNIAFEADVLNSLAITLAQRSGKHISTGSPMIDATLPGGPVFN